MLPAHYLRMYQTSGWVLFWVDETDSILYSVVYLLFTKCERSHCAICQGSCVASISNLASYLTMASNCNKVLQ